MRGLGLGLVLWALGATVASAAVLRIDVTGTPAVSRVFGDALRPDTTFSESIDVPVVEGTFSFSDDAMYAGARIEDILAAAAAFMRSSSGFLEFSVSGGPPTPVNCGGLLQMVCVRPLGGTGNPLERFSVDFLTGNIDFLTGGSPSGFGFHSLDDERYRSVFELCISCLEANGRRVFGIAGLELEASITSVRVSVVDEPAVVPLPASASLVLAGLGALVLLRRRARGGVVPGR